MGCLGYGARSLKVTSELPTTIRGCKPSVVHWNVGMTMIDSADAYGNGHNEILVGQAIRGRHKAAFLATKFGIVFEKLECLNKDVFSVVKV